MSALNFHRSTKGSDSSHSNHSGGDMPVYAKVNKPKKSSNDSGINSCESPRLARNGGAMLPQGAGHTKELNYTEVVFNENDGDSPRITDSPRQRRHPRVEYAEINPRPLPSMPTPSARALKGSPHHMYYNVSAQLTNKTEGNLGRESPRPLYENIDSNDFVEPPPPDNRGGNTTSQTDYQSSLDPRFSWDPNQSPAGSNSHNPKEITRQPVPKPRKIVRAPCIKAPHTTGQINVARVNVGRPQAPLPTAEENQLHPVEIEHSDSDTTVHTYNNVKISKPMNYENTSVGIVNNLITSHKQPNKSLSPKPRTDLRPHSPRDHPSQDKMATFDLFSDVNTMNPILNDYMLQLPPPPTQKAPGLPPEAAIWWSKIPELGESNMVEAIWDYKAAPGLKGVMSLQKSDVGVKVSKESNGWMGVKMGDKTGWVPVLFLGTYVPNPSPAKRGIKNIKEAVALHENKAWFLGKMTRQEAEELLVHHGKHRDFLVRESTNRVGDLTLSVKDKERIRHFPIQMTPSGKYDIGKAHFSDLTKVVAYYQANPLFFDDQKNNEPVSLGKPINRPKSP